MATQTKIETAAAAGMAIAIAMLLFRQRMKIALAMKPRRTGRAVEKAGNTGDRGVVHGTLKAEKLLLRTFRKLKHESEKDLPGVSRVI